MVNVLRVDKFLVLHCISSSLRPSETEAAALGDTISVRHNLIHVDVKHKVEDWLNYQGSP